MTVITGLARGIDLIQWIDGDLRVVPDTERRAVERVFEQPVEFFAAYDRPDAEDDLLEAVEDGLATIEPGSPEHAARAILSLPGGFLIEGDEFIPDYGEDESPEPLT